MNSRSEFTRVLARGIEETHCGCDHPANGDMRLRLLACQLTCSLATLRSRSGLNIDAVRALLLVALGHGDTENAVFEVRLHLVGICRERQLHGALE